MSNCQFHGYDALICPMCRAERIATESEAISSGAYVVGVFAWTGANDYKVEKALKIYKSKAAANKYAEKLNVDPLKVSAGGYVVRTVKAKMEQVGK